MTADARQTGAASPPATGDVDAGTREGNADALAQTFHRRHGADPDGVFAAPGRVNLIGEHTDYNGGLCLPIALPHATYVAVRRRRDRTLRVTSLQQSDTFTAGLDRLRPTAATGWPAYVVGVLWALKLAGIPISGMDLMIDSRVPIGAGLSSSAALECAVALAACSIADLEADNKTRQTLVQACIRAEQDIVGAPTGGMDQTICLFGRASHALLIDFSAGHHVEIPWTIPAAEVLVVDTRATHSLNDGQYGSRRAQCERASRLLGVDRLCDVADPDAALRHLAYGELRCRARHVFTENDRVRAAAQAIEDHDPARLGRLLTESHTSLRDDYEVSCVELDLAVETALAAGAYGARMTGGGFGGSALALVDPQHVTRVRTDIAQAFTDAHLLRPRFLVAQPSEGAHRVR